MEVTAWTWLVAVTGAAIMTLLGTLQLSAMLRPRSDWVIANVYGGRPDATDPRAYFAFNQGFAWADPLLWAPLQIAGSIGMLLGERWGFLLALTTERLSMRPEMRLFLAVGFLGSYTTFSTYMVESLYLWRDGGLWPGLINLMGNSLLGLFCALLGIWLARFF